MAKVVLGKRPENFKKTIRFMMVDPETEEVGEGMMDVRYKYRTLTEFGAFLDEWTKARKAELEAEQAQADADRKKAEDAGEVYISKELTNEELRSAQAQANADYLMEILTGWNLDMAFGKEAVLQLCNELPGAANEAMERYRAAITEGRLGN